VHREKLLMTGADGMMLVVNHPDPSTECAAKLAMLAAVSPPVAPGPDASA
jgi:hypothetical protein